VIAIIRLVGADVDNVRDWVGRPLPAILLVLLLIATFYHAALGLQVVIEDYVHAELTKLGLLIVIRLACFAFAVAGILAVVSMAVGMSN
jgi:succinate dehydrogenase / fumarate reductase membrane anchor subunit